MATNQKKTETQSTKKETRKGRLERLEGRAKKVTGHFTGFTDFVREQGVVGLAVGLAIGTAATATVKDIVNGFISPIVQFIVGTNDQLTQATWTFRAFGRTADFAWGAALSSTITLIATALVIYWLVNIFRLSRLDKKKDS